MAETQFLRETEFLIASSSVNGAIDVHLEPDVAELFPNAQAVNEALRFLIRINQQQTIYAPPHPLEPKKFHLP